MTSGEVEKKRNKAEYLLWLGLVILGAVLMALVSRVNPPLSANSISIDYYDQGILIVERNSDAKLMEKGGENFIVRQGVFKIDDIYQRVLGNLVNTWDEDKRVDQRLATVRIFFNNHTSGTYFMYDRSSLEEFFTLARTNVVKNR